MDDETFANLKEAYLAAPSSALAIVIVRELLSRGDTHATLSYLDALDEATVTDEVAELYRAAIAADPGKQDEQLNDLFGISSDKGVDQNAERRDRVAKVERCQNKRTRQVAH